MRPDIEEKSVAIQVISTLVNIKSAMADLILKPAGVPKDIYAPLLYKRNEATGQQLTKREIAPLIIEAIECRQDCFRAIRAIIEIAASWSSFHLAHDEYQARATVQKAREILGNIELMEAREKQQRELTRKEELARMEKERAELFNRRLTLLLSMFDSLVTYKDTQQRGYLLEDLLNRTFDLWEIPVFKSFRRNDGAEQIDGAFKIDGWYYIVECKWQQRLADIRQLDGLKGQIDRSGKQSMGLFLSIEGWSDNVPALLKQNPDKSIILMDGYDLRMVLSGNADLKDLILAKIGKLNLETEPFLSVRDYMNQQ